MQMIRLHYIQMLHFIQMLHYIQMPKLDIMKHLDIMKYLDIMKPQIFRSFFSLDIMKHLDIMKPLIFRFQNNNVSNFIFCLQNIIDIVFYPEVKGPFSNYSCTGTNFWYQYQFFHTKMSKNSRTIEFRQDFALNLLFFVEKNAFAPRSGCQKTTSQIKLKISSPEKNI